MSKEKQLLKNTAIVSIGKIATQLITFFLLPVYTAVLTTEEYGIVDLLNGITQPGITLRDGDVRFDTSIKKVLNSKTIAIDGNITNTGNITSSGLVTGTSGLQTSNGTLTLRWDSNVLELYRKYLSIEKQMCDKYESMYGPLTLDSNYINNNSWNWINRPWPWEVK